MAKSQVNRKRIPKSVLKLPDLEQSKSAVLNSLTSPSSQRTYDHAIREFIEWYCSEPRLAFNKTVVTRYRISLEQPHYASTTINLRLAAVRRLAYEAADCGLLCRPGCRDSPRKGRQATRDGEQLPASRLHFYTLYFFQESVVFVNNGALKSTLAPAQRIAGIISYWGMEMLFPALLDEFNHIIDGHSNLLSDVDAAATIESSPTL